MIAIAMTKVEIDIPEEIVPYTIQCWRIGKHR